MTRTSIRLAVLGLGLLLCGPAAATEGDAAAGKIKAEPCMGCHGIEGYFNVYPTYRVPRVAGQNVPYIVGALKAYANGQRPHPTMHAQSVSLSEQDMADIAAYFQQSGQQSSKQ